MDEDIPAKILAYLATQPSGAHAIQIGQAIGNNRITVGKYLDVLKAENKVRVRAVGQANLWTTVREQKKYKVLIVDDESAVVNLIKLSLGEENYDISIAHDGEEALQIVSSIMPDLVVLDVMMPKKDGLEVCKLLKSNILTRNIFVILLTAKSQTPDKLKGMQAGADHYMVKPFDPLELEALVKSMLVRREKEAAKHPLTGLDQGVRVRSVIERMQALEGTTILLIKIGGFQTFVESCGFKSSMQTLSMVVRLIQEKIKTHGNIDDYLGHIDDDTFVLITRHDAQKISAALKSEFAKAQPFLMAGKSACPEGLSLEIKPFTG